MIVMATLMVKTKHDGGDCNGDGDDGNGNGDNGGAHDDEDEDEDDDDDDEEDDDDDGFNDMFMMVLMPIMITLLCNTLLVVSSTSWLIL